MIASPYQLGHSQSMRRLAFLIALVAASLGGTGCSSISGSMHEALDQPDVDLAARDVLRITVISKTDANIRLQAGYYTQNRECAVQKWPGNPKIGHTKNEVIDVPTRKDGAVIEVLIDKYKPGRCHWAFGGVSVGAIIPGKREQEWNGLLAFSSDGLVPSKPLRITCREFGPARKLSCYSLINYLRHDIREVTFETQPYQEGLPK